MIEKMKMVYVVSSLSQKDNMLSGLKQLGVLHIAEKKSAEAKVSERFTKLSSVAGALREYELPKKEMKKLQSVPLLTGEEFESLYVKAQETLDRQTVLSQDKAAARNEIERIRPWGDFDPDGVRELKAKGIDFHFYLAPDAEYQQLRESEDISILTIGTIEKKKAIAVLGTLPNETTAAEFTLPEKGIDKLKDKITECDRELDECKVILQDVARYKESFNKAMLDAQNAENYSAVGQTMENDDAFIWLSGYLPESCVETFQKGASENGWAYAMDDVADDDEKVPTRVKFSKVSVLIKPIYDLLGILPGYRESDISLWFFLFFTLFFAMIIGDAGYGCLILIGTLAYVIKTKKKNTATFLLFILSSATIIWGAITGTWFGLEQAMNVPFLKALVVPNFSNYPELFGVSTSDQQNMIMKFSFSIGAIQMSLGTLIAIKRKLSEKNLSWIADLGWLIAVCAMYMLALYLIIGENIPVKPVFGLIGVAFVLVVIFGEMGPGKTFGQGLKAGLGSAFTQFLNTISCLGNVMSYIRLFAVGMAGLAISQSFNNIAASLGGPLVILAVVIVLFGHALNLVMCFLSVAVHGVRLNVLEFSGQVGLEWSGIPYEPFKENDKIIK